MKIYEQITKKIRQSVDMGNKYLFAQIPSFVMGHPHFDRVKAMQYIIRQFQIGGFMVQMVGEYEICISWRPTKKNKSQEDQNKEDESYEDFPTLVNLKKAANKYRTAR
jgi:hypothetical protein